jgi:uncharacterized protein YbjT (DUF2867 family)
MQSSKPTSSNPVIALMGATGNCGKPTVETLLKNQVPIRIISRDVDKAKDTFKHFKNNHLIEYKECCDCQAKQGQDTLCESLNGIEKLAIIPPSVQNREQITLKVIDAAKAAKVKHIVLISVPEGKKFKILLSPPSLLNSNGRRANGEI